MAAAQISKTPGSIYPTSNETGVRESMVPENIRNMLSDTSDAAECFVNQRFSNRLQIFLVGYNNNIYTEHSPYL